MSTEIENSGQLNALLQKAGGSIANLTAEEKQLLQRLVGREVAKDYRETFAAHYPQKNMIAALLLEEAYKRRMTTRQMIQTLGMSRVHFTRIIAGKAKPGLYYIQAIHEKLGVDANFLIENLSNGQ